MKIKMLICGAFLCASSLALGQEATITSTSILKNETVKITIESNKQFNTGSQNYVLTIGDQKFNNHTVEISPNGKSMLVFTIPKEKYEKIPERAEPTLCYGNMSVQQQNQSIQKGIGNAQRLKSYKKSNLSKKDN